MAITYRFHRYNNLIQFLGYTPLLPLIMTLPAQAELSPETVDWIGGEFLDFFAQTGTSGLDMSQIFSNIGMQIDPIMNFLVVLCYVVGVGLSVSAIMKLKKFGTRTAFMSVEMSLVGPFMQFFIGVALFYMPYFISSINLTIFTSSGVENELGYSSSSVDYNAYVEPVLGIIQIIGVISFMRGWLMLSKATNPGQQPGAISKGVTHVVGGILAVNIRTFITVIYQTLGLT